MSDDKKISASAYEEREIRLDIARAVVAAQFAPGDRPAADMGAFVVAVAEPIAVWVLGSQT